MGPIGPARFDGRGPLPVVDRACRTTASSRVVPSASAATSAVQLCPSSMRNRRRLDVRISPRALAPETSAAAAEAALQCGSWHSSCLSRPGGHLLQRRPRAELGARVPQDTVHGATRACAAPPRLCIVLLMFPGGYCAALGARAPRLHLASLLMSVAIATSSGLELRVSWRYVGLLLGGGLRSALPLGRALGSFIHVRARVPLRVVIPP